MVINLVSYVSFVRPSVPSKHAMILVLIDCIFSQEAMGSRCVRPDYLRSAVQ